MRLGHRDRLDGRCLRLERGQMVLPRRRPRELIVHQGTRRVDVGFPAVPSRSSTKHVVPLPVPVPSIRPDVEGRPVLLRPAIANYRDGSASAPVPALLRGPRCLSVHSPCDVEPVLHGRRAAQGSSGSRSTRDENTRRNDSAVEAAVRASARAGDSSGRRSSQSGG